jgi:hypothetical protein
MIKLVSEIYKDAYLTAGITFVGGSIEVLAGFFIYSQQIHLKPIKSDVHNHCEENNWFC